MKRYPPLPSVGVPRTSGTSVKSPAGANAGRGSHMSMRGGPPSGTPPRRTSAASVSQGGETGACGGGAAFQHRSNPNAPWEPFAIEHNATIAAAIANGSGSGRVTLAGKSCSADVFAATSNLCLRVCAQIFQYEDLRCMGRQLLFLY